MSERNLSRIAIRNPETLRLAAILLGVTLLFAILKPEQFISVLNMQSISFGLPEVGLLSLAMVITMASGGIDLSIVGITALSAITIAGLGQWGLDNAVHQVLLTALAIPAAILVGMFCGLLNGLLIAYVGIRPILATLATGSLFTGVAIAITRGKSWYVLPEPIAHLGLATLVGIPTTLFLFVVLAAVLWFIMRRTTFGARALMFGSNPEAARFSGFNIARIHIQTYVLVGAICGLTAMFITARAASASAGFGATYIMLAITVAILGGTDPVGGRIRITGAVLATVLLQVVSNGFNLLQINAYIYQIVQGLILAVFVVSAIRPRGRKPSRRRHKQIVHPQPLTQEGTS